MNALNAILISLACVQNICLEGKLFQEQEKRAEIIPLVFDILKGTSKAE